MKKLIALSVLVLAPVFASATTDVRCGWYANPTPANHWITDGQGDWIIMSQGSHQAQGSETIAMNTEDKKLWVKTSPTGYGYGCACATVTYDLVPGQKYQLVKSLRNLRQQALKICRTDKNLPQKK